MYAQVFVMQISQQVVVKMPDGPAELILEEVLKVVFYAHRGKVTIKKNILESI